MYYHLAMVVTEVEPPDRMVERERFPGDKTTPSMLSLNARSLVYSWQQELGPDTRINDIPDSVWKEYAKTHDMIWFLGVYQASPGGVELAKKDLHMYQNDGHSDATEADVIGSSFSIYDYSPDKHVAKDWKEWDRFRKKLNNFGLKVIGDFVPNHVGADHPWTITHPEYLLRVNRETYEQHPDDYFAVKTVHGTQYYAHGRDEWFDSWKDTGQVNYANIDSQIAMMNLLSSVSEHFDGVRCDMAMLPNWKKFSAIWGKYLHGDPWPGDFWETAIPEIKRRQQRERKNFLFMAEAYGDDDIELLSQYGFDYIYQKHFYDDLARIVWRDKKIFPWNITETLRHFLRSDRSRRHKWVFFAENHDEPRAVRIFGYEPSLAAATVMSVIPNSLFLVHEDQEKGFTVRPRIQLRRTRKEPVNQDMVQYYKRLYSLKEMPVFQYGERTIPEVSNANIIPQQGQLGNEYAALCTNFCHDQSEGFLRMPLGATDVKVFDLATGEYVKEIAPVTEDGLRLILSSWRSQVVTWRA